MSSNPYIIAPDAWHTEPRGWRDVIRCLLGRHRNITIGTTGIATVRRCSCGAINLSDMGWLVRSAPVHTAATQAEREKVGA
jgi:hypothetical protein